VRLSLWRRWEGRKGGRKEGGKEEWWEGREEFERNLVRLSLCGDGGCVYVAGFF